MEQDKFFKLKLFVPPRLSNAQISAVKPQTNTRDGAFFQGVNKRTEDVYNLPFVMKSTSQHEDPASQKVKLVPEMDEESLETKNELYSKLYKEAEKIKRWKVTVEYELKEKERKLQENRQLIKALRKAIQELQFENEKISLKFEDVMHENEDLLKQNNATINLCNLLKDTCTQSMEKSSKYEREREETRLIYVDLNNNIERMILAFEELRVQAENSRLEMYFQIKEETEKVAQLEKQYKRERNVMEKQVSTLTMQNDEKDNKMKDINIELKESRERITELEKIRKQQDEVLNKAESKQQVLFTELEETKSNLEKAENVCKTLENELQTAVKTFIQVTEEKKVILEELKEARVLHASITDELHTTVSNLKELVEKEKNRWEELKAESDILVLELQKKSSELEVMAKLKNDKEKQVEEKTEALESSIKVQKDLEHQLQCEQSEKKILMKEKETRNSDCAAIQMQMQGLMDEKLFLEKTVEKFQERETKLNETLQIREKETLDLEMQLSRALENKQNCLQQFTALKADLKKEILKNEQLNMDWNKLLLEKEHTTSEKDNMLNELKKLQEVLKDNRKSGEKATKQIEELEETNIQLRNELESLKEMKKKAEEAKSKLEESEENVRNIENERSKKEKQLKRLENKITSLKKQIENKAKNIEILQQENKNLQKQVAKESKQSIINEGKVNKLQLELENINQLKKEAINSHQNEIEEARATEEKLLKEVEKMKFVADEAMTLQKETNIQCQHKITEIVALMEKHKHQYDKTVEEKDIELESYKTKEQELMSTIKSLDNALSCEKNEISSLQEQLKAVSEEKENLTREAKKDNASKTERKHKNIQTSFMETTTAGSLPNSVLLKTPKNLSHIYTPINVNKLKHLPEKSSWTPAKTYIVKTPPEYIRSGGNTNLLSEEGTKKKRKVLLEVDTRSNSSENNDFLNIAAEEEMLRKRHKDYPQASHLLNIMTSKKAQTPKIPGSSVKRVTVKKIQEAGWTAVSKIDMRQKMKEAGKLFT